MKINKTFSDVEKGFNVAATIPIVGIASSIFRVTAAEIQVMGAIGVGLIGLTGQIVATDTKRWEDLTKQAAENLLHGVLNIIRGLGELFLALTIIGSLGLLAYQVLSKNKFNPIIMYN